MTRYRMLEPTGTSWCAITDQRKSATSYSYVSMMEFRNKGSMHDLVVSQSSLISLLQTPTSHLPSQPLPPTPSSTPPPLDLAASFHFRGNFIGRSPYSSGSSCSECGEDLPFCVNNLCCTYIIRVDVHGCGIGLTATCVYVCAFMCVSVF